jgi:hypothetical protein
LLVHDSSADLAVSPRSQLVFVGDTVRLNCSTDSSLPVNWWRTTVTSQEKEIFILNRTKSEYDRKLRIVRNVAGQFDLFIPHAELTDAGRYTCVDRAGGGKKVTVELIVLEFNPTCYSSANDVDFMLGANSSIEICLRYDAARNVGCPRTSLTPHLYAPTSISLFPYQQVYAIGQRISCLAMAHPPPTYNWIDARNSTIAWNISSLKLRAPGSYRCVATNELGRIFVDFEVTSNGSFLKAASLKMGKSGVADNSNYPITDNSAVSSVNWPAILVLSIFLAGSILANIALSWRINRHSANERVSESSGEEVFTEHPYSRAHLPSSGDSNYESLSSQESAEHHLAQQQRHQPTHFYANWRS